MFRKFLSIAFVAASSFTFSQTYYVAVGGSASLSTDELTPGDLSFAVVNAPSGSTVYVKQGDYGALNLTCTTDSVSFIGYTSSIGDISATDIPDYDSYDTALVKSIFPMLDANNQASGGTAFIIDANATTLENFYVRNYSSGFTITGTASSFINCIGEDFGNQFNSYHGWGYQIYGNYNSFENCFLLNAGAQGMTAKGNYNVIEGCQVYADDTTSFAAMDYYILVTANSSTSEAKYNRVSDCHVERIGNLAHSGHGLCLTTFYIHEACPVGGGFCYNPIYADDSVTFNLIENCTSAGVGEPVLLRGPGVRYNDMENVVSENYGGLTVTTGASFNTFTNCHVKDTYFYDVPASSSIAFNAAVEFFAHGWGHTTDMNVSYSAQGTYPWDTLVCAEGNEFRNCLFENVSAAVMNSSYSEFYDDLGNPVNRLTRKIVKDNKFINCTFVGREDSVDVFCYAMRGNEGNEFINCIINGFGHWESRYFPTSMSAGAIEAHSIIPTNNTYNHCNFYGNSFDTSIVSDGVLNGPVAPVTIGFQDSVRGTFIECNTYDPGFTDPSTGDYSLQLCSCGTIDLGLTAVEMVAAGYDDLDFDFANLFRPCQDIYDIGAYEYQDCAVESIDEQEQLTIYPNPTNGLIRFELAEFAEVELFDFSGRLLSSEKLAQGQHEIELSGPTGIYLLRISSGSNVDMVKVVKR